MNRKRDSSAQPKSPLEERFAALCQEHGVPTPKTQYMFHPVRKWALDFAWPARRVGVEIQGGVWKKDEPGAHNRGSGYNRDCEKLNAAQAMGWRVFWVTPNMMRTAEIGAFMEMLKAVLKTGYWAESALR